MQNHEPTELIKSWCGYSDFEYLQHQAKMLIEFCDQHYISLGIDTQAKMLEWWDMKVKQWNETFVNRVHISIDLSLTYYESKEDSYDFSLPHAPRVIYESSLYDLQSQNHMLASFHQHLKMV